MILKNIIKKVLFNHSITKVITVNSMLIFQCCAKFIYLTDSDWVLNLSVRAPPQPDNNVFISFYLF